MLVLGLQQAHRLRQRGCFWCNLIQGRQGTFMAHNITLWSRRENDGRYLNLLRTTLEKQEDKQDWENDTHINLLSY